MVRHTIPDKSNTIIQESKNNHGLTPYSVLMYGNKTARILLHFDIENMKSCCNKVTYTHRIKMTNCGSINPNELYGSNYKRAVSFDVIAIKVSDEWDEGIGFDRNEQFWTVGESSKSTEASNWFNAKSIVKWSQNGFMNDSFVLSEYNKFLAGKTSAVLGVQHFDHGNENLDIDITKYVNEVISTGKNYGICLMFAPEYEQEDRKDNTTYYTTFFNDKTNTMFIPYVETKSTDSIKDDRFNFIKKKENRLYFYTQNDGVFFDLDRVPICMIDETEYDVVHQEKGVYYAIITDPETYCSDEGFYNDVWSDVSIEGERVDDIELEFYASDKRTFVGSITPQQSFEPLLYGINDNEILQRGQVRRVNVKYHTPYDKTFAFINDTYYRIYMKDCDREFTVIDWDGINNVGDNCYFDVRSDEYAAGKYFVDIKIVRNGEVKIFKNKLQFVIPNDTTRMRR